jgi:hypothetical protein
MKSENAPDTSDQRDNRADSIEAAAGALGRSIVFLQELKARGCPAFRHGRVWLQEVEDYIAAQNLEPLEREIERESKVDVDIKRLRLRRMEHEMAQREGRFITVEDHHETMCRFNEELKSTLRATMEDSGPDRLTMRTREEATHVLREMFDEFCVRVSRQ